MSLSLTRRHVLPAIEEPSYEIDDVPRANYCGKGSCVQSISKREEWLKILGEMVLVSNRAEEDYEKKLLSSGQLVFHPGKPLCLEYLADRIDTDDPLWGWTIRTQVEGWLQGYVCITTFTTWLQWFRWDSLCEASLVLPYSNVEVHPEWWGERIVDADGRLARALNRQIFDGDWTNEGVIWPRIAEVSLLAGLGCGGFLLDCALDALLNRKMENGELEYDYCVVQATENAVPFYESRGFVRVGAIARYEEKKEETGDSEEGDDQQEDSILRGTSSPCEIVTALEGDTPLVLAKRYPGTRASDIVFLNQRLYAEFTENTYLPQGTEIRIPNAQHRKSQSTQHVIPIGLKAKELKDVCQIPFGLKPGSVSENGLWYSSYNSETVQKVAKKFNVSCQELVAFNRPRFPSLQEKSSLHASTLLLLPDRGIDLNKVYSLVQQVDREKEEIELYEQEVQDPALKEFYLAKTVFNSTMAEGVQTKTLTEVLAYRHWTFPDEKVSLSSPSYMMALPLNQAYIQKHSQAQTPSLAEQIEKLEASPVHNPPFAYGPSEPVPQRVVSLPTEISVCFKSRVIKSWRQSSGVRVQDQEVFWKNLPLTPPKPCCLSRPLKPQPPPVPCPPLTSSQEYIRQCRHVVLHDFPHFSVGKATEYCKNQWKELSPDQRTPWIELALHEKSVYQEKIQEHRKQLIKFHHLFGLDEAVYDLSHPEGPRLRKKLKVEDDDPIPSEFPVQQMLSASMFGSAANRLVNKVVTLLPKPNSSAREKWVNADVSHPAPQYYFTLTYIPDLQWCRLVPLKQVGVFQTGQSNKKNFERHVGRPKWMVCSESEGKEIDVSAKRCRPVFKAYSIKKVQDADEEQWDIYETSCS